MAEKVNKKTAKEVIETETSIEKKEKYTPPAEDNHVMISMESDPVIRRIMLVLQKGDEFRATSFPIHDHYVTQLSSALKSHDEEQFLSILRAYLNASIGRLTQSPQEGEVTHLIGHTDAMIQLYGLNAIGKPLLRSARPF